MATRPLSLASLAAALSCAGLLLVSGAAFSQAQATPPAAPAKAPLSAVDSDPVKLGLMVGSPPPADKQITFQNAGQFPNLRWALQHMRELVPSRNVWRGTGAASELPRGERDWSGFAFDDGTGARLSIDTYAERTYTDAIVVLHKGRVVLERYWTGMTPNTLHSVFSVTKSLTGVLAALSGYGQPQDIEDSRAAGLDFHLVKPPDQAKLMDVLRRAAMASVERG